MEEMGRESRWEKDAMTVEIVFALVTAGALAAAVFAALWLPAWAVGLSTPAGEGLLTVGGVLAVAAAAWRVARVLLRFDARRRRGR
ncbi:DUF6332 family protein [Streptomyces sp. NPDC012888]|uniref:DUF6332 family protein n=1 Tax=Streptomyces sp. NPDC012888 TaxID=3364855 RepID=UPI0036A31B88